jgi:hypothetical protein
LEARLDGTSYRDVLEGLMAAIESRGASVPPSILLDTLDSTIVGSCADLESRTRLFSYAAGMANRHHSRWEAGDLRFLRDLAREAECDGIVTLEEPLHSEAETGSGLECLEDAYVGIYTLTESAAARAATYLKSVVPGIGRVNTSSASGGTEGLAAMASSADVFVMVTRSAKHAATDFIQAHRGGQPTIRPIGKGTSSIIEALRGYCAN